MSRRICRSNGKAICFQRSAVSDPLKKPAQLEIKRSSLAASCDLNSGVFFLRIFPPDDGEEKNAGDERTSHSGFLLVNDDCRQRPRYTAANGMKECGG